MVWLHRNECAATDDITAKALSSSQDVRLYCVPYNEAVSYRLDGLRNSSTEDEKSFDSPTVVSATLFRPIGLAGTSKDNSTLVRFRYGFAGTEKYILLPDGEIESLQDALQRTRHRSHIEQIHVEGYDVVAVTTKTLINIVLAKLCIDFNASMKSITVEERASSSTDCGH